MEYFVLGFDLTNQETSDVIFLGSFLTIFFINDLLNDNTVTVLTSLEDVLFELYDAALH